MTTEEQTFEFDPTIADEIDPDSVDRTESEFPTIQWHRGDPKMKKTGGMDFYGGWFIPESQAPVDLTEYGWEKITWVHDMNSETDGYTIRELTLSVIRDRRRWEVFENKTRSLFAWNDYDAAKAIGRASGRSHYLVLIKGMEELGPFVLTMKGMASVYFYNRKNSPKSALGTFDSIVVKAGNDAVKKSGRRALMPRRAFWLTVGASRDDKGNPLFVEVGSGNDKSTMVVPMALGLTDKAEKVNLTEFFVGRELLGRASELWNEANDWAKAWDDIVAGSSSDTNDEGKSPAPAADAPETITEDVAEQFGL